VYVGKLLVQRANATKIDTISLKVICKMTRMSSLKSQKWEVRSCPYSGEDDPSTTDTHWRPLHRVLVAGLWTCSAQYSWQYWRTSSKPTTHWQTTSTYFMNIRFPVTDTPRNQTSLIILNSTPHQICHKLQLLAIDQYVRIIVSITYFSLIYVISKQSDWLNLP